MCVCGYSYTIFYPKSQVIHTLEKKKEIRTLEILDKLYRAHSVCYVTIPVNS